MNNYCTTLNWLCHRSQNDPSDPRENRNPSLSSVQEELGSSRIFLQTFPLEEASSFCSHPPPSLRERLRTTDAFHFEALQLPGLCHQSPSPSRRDLVFLSTQGSDRGHYQGTESKLCFDQDSNQQFPSQPILFPSLGVCLQSCQLVQKALPTAKIPTSYLRDDSNRIPGIASQISQNTTSECTQIACRVHIQKDPGSYHPKYQKDEALINFYHFAKFLSNGMSESPVL